MALYSRRVTWLAAPGTTIRSVGTNALELPGLPPDFVGERRWSTRAGSCPCLDGLDVSAAHKNHDSCGYYVLEGTEPDCEGDEARDCLPVQQNAKTPGIWSPLSYFDTVKKDGELGNIQSVQVSMKQAKAGTLAAVSWMVAGLRRQRSGLHGSIS